MTGWRVVPGALLLLLALDLVVVVPDKDTEQAFKGLLQRHQSLGIRPVRYDVIVHPNKDPGCYKSGDQLAAAFRHEAMHALVVFDLAWEGAPSLDPTVLEHEVEARLQPLWADRARCVVIDPELEAWVWSDSPHVENVLGWRGRAPSLRAWLQQEGLWPEGQPKPPDPERAFRRAVRVVSLPPSASLFRQLAETVGLRRCNDPSFGKVAGILQGWFRQEDADSN
jgi:hypothetical protein